MGIATKGDYIGFSFNGISSSNLGILRVVEGSRQSWGLLPDRSDRVGQIPGMMGSVYFGTDHIQRTFEINFAFDDLGETQIARIQRDWGDVGIRDLIFEEHPYKVWSARTTGVPSLRYIPFDQEVSPGTFERVYKGEGSVTFICYYPFATAPFKNLNQYLLAEYPNRDEWAAASGIRADVGSVFDVITDASIKLYNPGHLQSPLTIYMNFSGSTIAASNFSISGFGALNLGAMTKKGSDVGVRINFKTNMMEGYVGSATAPVLSGNLYNEYYVGGEFFKVPLIQSPNAPYTTLDHTGAAIVRLDYPYLYY